MNRRRGLLLASAAFLCTLLVSAPAAAMGGENQSQGQGNIRMGGYPSTSWALGVVAPEGARLQGGGMLKWESVSNLTCLTTLPQISDPNGIVYAVLSAMAADGSVMQVAAGVYPNSSLWLAYSWYIQGVQTTRPNYGWILNASGPAMSPNDSISLSMFQSSGRWELRVADTDTGNATSRLFPPGIAPSLKDGEQEAFALESYSRTAGDFQRMGNLTLSGLFADGQRITGGLYTYGGWDPSRNPVFAVGSSGSSPPIFIQIAQAGDGAFVWSYSDVSGWTRSPVGTLWAGVAVLALVAALAFVWVANRVVKRPARP